jgi:hypothetical protein
MILVGESPAQQVILPARIAPRSDQIGSGQTDPIRSDPTRSYQIGRGCMGVLAAICIMCPVRTGLVRRVSSPDRTLVARAARVCGGGRLRRAYGPDRTLATRVWSGPYARLRRRTLAARVRSGPDRAYGPDRTLALRAVRTGPLRCVYGPDRTLGLRCVRGPDRTGPDACGACAGPVRTGRACVCVCVSWECVWVGVHGGLQHEHTPPHTQSHFSCATHTHTHTQTDTDRHTHTHIHTHTHTHPTYTTHSHAHTTHMHTHAHMHTYYTPHTPAYPPPHLPIIHPCTLIHSPTFTHLYTLIHPTPTHSYTLIHSYTLALTYIYPHQTQTHPHISLKTTPTTSITIY